MLDFWKELEETQTLKGGNVDGEKVQKRRSSKEIEEYARIFEERSIQNCHLSCYSFQISNKDTHFIFLIWIKYNAAKKANMKTKFNLIWAISAIIKYYR